jgi:hypothetical protein
MDLFCGIAIWNNWITGMRLVGTNVVFGSWDPAPPDEIDPGQVANFTLSGNPFRGPDGSVTYQFAYPNGDQQLTATVEFIFATPYSGPNVVDWSWQNMPTPRFNGSVRFFARADISPWLLNTVKSENSPVIAVYTLFGNS